MTADTQPRMQGRFYPDQRRLDHDLAVAAIPRRLAVALPSASGLDGTKSEGRPTGSAYQILRLICRYGAMKLTLDIQTGGSLAVVGAFVASECAAWLLDAYPGSSIAWHLNVGVFRAFENARVDMLPSRFLFGPASLPIALLLLVLILVARKLRSRFAVALFANLSFVGSVMLAYASFQGTATSKAVSLAGTAFAQGTDLLLVGVLLVASLAAFAVSHWSFARAIRLADPRPLAGRLIHRASSAAR